MLNRVSTDKIWLNPYFIAIIGIIILYSVNYAPAAFVLTGFIYGFLSKQIINWKTLLKFAVSFSVIQLIINFIIIMFLERSYLFFAPEIYLKKYLGYFALSLFVGSLIFLVVNLIVYGIYKLFIKITNKQNEDIK